MATRSAYLRRARHWIANRGWGGFLRELWRRAGIALSGEPVPDRAGVDRGVHPFDVAHGVDTTGLVWGEALGTTAGDPAAHGDAPYWATGYYGIAPSAFLAAVEMLRLAWSRFTFVDIGCGKGRALLLALRFPFRRVLGVELSPELAAVAAENVQRFHADWRCEEVAAEVLAGDATSFALPEGPLVLFLYHPFARPVMERFLAHVQAAARAERREIVLLYANPELGPLLEGTAGITLLWKFAFPLSTEDSAADRFASRYENFAAYWVEG